MDVEPTGLVRVVPPRDLVFSTSDARGVIDGANAVFCRIAALSEGDLRGSPHNVIRHPDMPAGVFTLMWDLLEAGRPMAGYLLNLAADGAAYWVFATVTPLDGGYLSVRQGPAHDELWGELQRIYRRVRPLELQAREAGASRSTAARLGANELLTALRGLGFGSYEAFQAEALPLEVAARRDATTEPPRDAPGPMQALVDAVRGLEGALAGQVVDLTGLGTLVGRLDAAGAGLEPVLAGLQSAVDAAVRTSSRLDHALPALSTMAAGLRSTPEESAAALASTRHDLARVRAATADLRFVGALARLHAETVGQFAREMAAGDASSSAPLYIGRLRRALQLTTEGLISSSLLAGERLQSAAAMAHDLEEHLRRMQHALSTWRLLVLRHGRAQGLALDTSAVDDQLRTSLHQADELRSLAELCLRAARPLDVQQVALAVGAVVQATRQHEAAPWPDARRRLTPR